MKGGGGRGGREAEEIGAFTVSSGSKNVGELTSGVVECGPENNVRARECRREKEGL